MSANSHVTTNVARSLLLAAGVVVAAMATALPAAVREHMSFTYQKIIWKWEDGGLESMIEDNFRRAAAESGLKVSPAEIAGAAKAAVELAVQQRDNWNERQMVIRGCGPAGEFCFVITCNGCSIGN